MDPLPSWFTPVGDESPEWGPCPSCGTANAAAARFCQACGRPLLEAETEPVALDVLTAVVVELLSANDAFALPPDADALLGYVRDVLVGAGAVIRDLPGNPNTVAAVFGPASRTGATTMTAIGHALAVRDALTGDVAVRIGIGASDVRADDEGAIELWRGRVVDLAVRLSRMAGPAEVILGEGAYRLVRGQVYAEAVDPRADPNGEDVGPLRLQALVTESPWAGEAWQEPAVGDEVWHEPAVADEGWQEPAVGDEVWHEPAVADEGWQEPTVAEEVWQEPADSNEVWQEPAVSDEVWQDAGEGREAPEAQHPVEQAGWVAPSPPVDPPTSEEAHPDAAGVAGEPALVAAPRGLPADSLPSDPLQGWPPPDQPHLSTEWRAEKTSDVAAPNAVGSDDLSAAADDALADISVASNGHHDQAPAGDGYAEPADAPAIDQAPPPSTPLLERETALRRLHDALDRAIGDGRPVVVTVGGEPGSGRTSVARWFAGEAADRAWTVELTCRRPDAGGAAWPFAPLIRAVLGIDASTDPATFADRVREIVGWDRRDRADAVAAYLAGDTGSAHPDQLPAAIADLLSGTVARRPLVVLVDDADRAPSPARDAFDRVVGSVAGPLLVVLVARGSGDVGAERLSAPASAELTERLLSRPNLPADAISAIVQACRGLPLAIEHLVAMLVDEGHLRWEYERWTPAVDLASLPLPADLASLVARRIGALGADERAVMAVAAAGGETFDVRSIGSALGVEPDGVVPIVAALVDRGIFRRVDDQRLVFGHDVVAEMAATYAEREPAAVMHRSAADALARELPAGPDLDEAIGAHLEHAFRLSASDREAVGRRAAEHLVRAARGASDAGDEDAALAMLRRAAAVLPVQDANRARLLLDSAAMLAARDERAPAERLLGEAVHAARAAGDGLLELRAAVARARMLATGSRIEHEIEALRDAADAAIAAGTAREDEATAAAGWSARGWVHAVRGHFAGAADAFAHAAAASAAAGLRREELAALRDLAAATVDGPAPLEESIDRARWTVDRVRGTAAEPSASATLAVLLARAGRTDEAREVLGRIADAPAEEHDAATIAARAAMVELHSGAPDRAESWLRIPLGLDLSDPDRGAVLSWLAYAQTVSGDAEAAVESADAAASLADEDDVIAQVTWRAAKARCMAMLGRVPDARALVRLALRLADQTDLAELRARTRLDLGDVLLASGRANEAAPAVRAALRVLERKGSVAEIARAGSMLDRVSGRTTAAPADHETAPPADDAAANDRPAAEAETDDDEANTLVATEVDDAQQPSDVLDAGDVPLSDNGSSAAAPAEEGDRPEPEAPTETKRERHWFW